MPSVIGASDYLSRQANFAAFLQAIAEKLESGMAEQMAVVEQLAMMVPGDGDAVLVPFTDPLASMSEWKNGGTVDRDTFGMMMRSVLCPVKDWSHVIEVMLNQLSDDKIGYLQKRVDSQASVVPRHYAELIGQALVNGFTAQGNEFDSKAIFADDHPITGSATVNDNLSALNLDATNLEVGLKAFAAMRNPAGLKDLDGDLLPMGSKATALIVGDYNRAVAQSLVKAVNNSSGASNIYYGSLDLIVIDKFSGSHAKKWVLADLSNPAAKPVALVETQGPRITNEEPFNRKVMRAGIDTRDNAIMTHYGLVWGSTGT